MCPGSGYDWIQGFLFRGVTMIIDLTKRIQARRAAIRAQQKANVARLGEPDSNFFRVSHLTVTSERFQDLPEKSKVLFYTLCRHRNRYQRSKAYFTRSFRQLSKDTGWAINTVRAHQIILQRAGFLLCVARPGGRTRYQIIDIRDNKTLL